MTSLGIKRSCQACGCKYYDFNKTPIVCPSCEAEFDPEVLLKSRRLKPISAEKPKSAEAPDAPDATEAAEATETTAPEVADVADIALSEDDIEAGDNEDAVDDDGDAPIINVRKSEDDEESIKSDNPITSDFLDDEGGEAEEENKDDEE